MSVKSIFRYRKTFINWLEVLTCVVRNQYPFKGKLRSGDIITIENSFQCWLASYGVTVNYDKKNDITSFKFNGFAYKFLGAGKNGDLADVYGSQEFKQIDFRNKTVLDIGANIGDSAIYFSTMGAKRVIAVEPYPKSFYSTMKEVF